MIVQFCQKIIGIQINLKHVVVLSKDKVFIYDLAGMTFVHRLNLEFHLGRVILAANASMDDVPRNEGQNFAVKLDSNMQED